MLRLVIDIWERKGLNAFVSGDYARAEAIFLRIKRHSPYHRGILHNLGLIELALKKYPEAEAFFREDLDRFGESLVRHRSMADLYYVWDRREEAVKHYELALAQCEDARDRVLLERRAAICRDPVLFARVAESYRLFEEGNEAMRRQAIEEAAEAFTRSVELDETNFQSLNNLGVILLNEKKDHDGAIRYFRAAAALSSLPFISGNLRRAETEAVDGSSGSRRNGR